MDEKIREERKKAHLSRDMVELEDGEGSGDFYPSPECH